MFNLPLVEESGTTSNCVAGYFNSGFKIKSIKIQKRATFFIYFILFFISPLFNQVGQLRTTSHLQLQPGQDKAKHCDSRQQHMGYVG